MPANPTVTVTAYVTLVPSETASYTFTLINPVPVVTSATPIQLQTGGTQTVTLYGSDFLTTTTVQFNGTALPVTYVSSTRLTVPVPVAANASGSVTLQVQNPSPGGGSPVSVSLPIPVNSIALAPTSQTGPVVALGGTIKIGATVTGSLLTTVTWGVSGAGTITTGGTYTAPTSMPTGSVAVTATLVSNPAITASYPLTLVDPVPALKSASPNQALAGATASITLSGTGFVQGTVILVNGVAVPTTYNSATSVVAQISAPAGSGTSLSVQAQDPAPGGGTSAAMLLPVATLQISATDPVDGTNPGTVTLAVPVNFSAVNTDTAHLGRGMESSRSRDANR